MLFIPTTLLPKILLLPSLKSCPLFLFSSQNCFNCSSFLISRGCGVPFVQAAASPDINITAITTMAEMISSACLELTISIPGLSSSPSVPSSGEGGGGVITRDLDINQIPSGGEEDCMEDEDESLSGGGPPRKKLRLTKEQSRLLEESFRQNHTLNPKQKEVLAMQLKLKPRQVEVWFQNRRARSKLKQTEMECEYLKRWFGSLTEQNRRLQKEVEELRAMKVGPPTVIISQNCKPLPASTLTMCPRCERVTTVVQDKGGPTTTSTASTTTSVSPTLSAKGPLFQSGRHPSAAC